VSYKNKKDGRETVFTKFSGLKKNLKKEKIDFPSSVIKEHLRSSDDICLTAL
jgi:hypothetical protein